MAPPLPELAGRQAHAFQCPPIQLRLATRGPAVWAEPSLLRTVVGFGIHPVWRAQHYATQKSSYAPKRTLDMEDLFQDTNDPIEVEPADLGAELVAVLTSSLAKKLASQYEKAWTEKQESDMQKDISTLVAAANARGLKTIRVIVTRPNGERVWRDLDIDRISKSRSLQ
jgi:hypothetical protein